MLSDLVIKTDEIELGVNLKISDSEQNHPQRYQNSESEFKPMNFLIVV